MGLLALDVGEAGGSGFGGFHSVAVEEGVDGGFLSAESLVEGHGMLGAAPAEDVVAERVGGLAVEDAVFLEH